MHDPSKTRCLPARYRDQLLAICAYCGYGAVIIFILAQHQLRHGIAPDLQFQLVLALVMIGGTAAICRRMQPSLAALISAMRVGRAAAQGNPPPRPLHSARYRTYGRVGVACNAATIGIMVGADTGVLNLHGIHQYLALLTLSSLGAVGTIVRISVPFIDSATRVFLAAYSTGSHGQGNPEDTGQIPRIPSGVGS